MKKYSIQFASLVLFSAIFASGMAIGMEELPSLPSDVRKVIAAKTLRVLLDELQELNEWHMQRIKRLGFNEHFPKPILLQGRKVRERGNLFYETFLKDYFETAPKRDLKYLGKTGVFGASEPPPIEMIFLLTENGADPNTKNYKGNTVLHLFLDAIASLDIGREAESYVDREKLDSKDIHNLLEIESKIQFFVKHKINLNAQNHNGDTAAHALLNNAPDTNPEVLKELVKFLKRLGLDMNIKNNEGLTACDIAKQKKDSYGDDWNWQQSLKGICF